MRFTNAKLHVKQKEKVNIFVSGVNSFHFLNWILNVRLNTTGAKKDKNINKILYELLTLWRKDIGM